MAATKEIEKASNAEKLGLVRDLLSNYKMRIKDLLPDGVNEKKLLQTIVFACQQNPKLLECDRLSFLGAVVEAAGMGIYPNDGTHQGSLVPFWNGSKGCNDVKFIPEYRGLISLAKNTDEISHVETACVYPGEAFECEKGLNPVLKHSPGEFKPGEATHAYMIVTYKTGQKQFEVMTRKELLPFKEKALSKIQNKDAHKYSPWVTAEDEMFKKTVLRRGLKVVSSSSQKMKAVQKALVLADQADNDIPQNLGLQLDEREFAPVKTNETKELDGAKEAIPAPTLGKQIPQGIPTQDEAATKAKLLKQGVLASIIEFESAEELTEWWNKKSEETKADPELKEAYNVKWKALKGK